MCIEKGMAYAHDYGLGGRIGRVSVGWRPIHLGGWRLLQPGHPPTHHPSERETMGRAGSTIKMKRNPIYKQTFFYRFLFFLGSVRFGT